MPDPGQQAKGDGLPAKDKGRRLRPEDRASASKLLLRRYRNGESIRELASSSGYSIGLVRNLLLEGGVEFRPKGGASKRRTRSVS